MMKEIFGEFLGTLLLLLLGNGDWSYAWIPVVGPIIGAVLAVLVFGLF